jgi:hypothetical protein
VLNAESVDDFSVLARGVIAHDPNA